MSDPKLTISNKFMVKVGGSSLDSTIDQRLRTCWVESSLNLPAAFHLTVQDPGGELADVFRKAFVGGQSVAVYGVADQQGRDAPLVVGAITGIEVDFDGRLTTTVVRGLDHAFKMMRHRRSVGYNHQNATAIVKKLAERDGVEVGFIDATPLVYKRITQPNISDWDFVNELARRENMVVEFDNLGRLQFRPIEAAVGSLDVGAMPTELEFGVNILRCRTGVTASDQVETVTVRGWDVDEHKEIKETEPVPAFPGLNIKFVPADAIAGFGSATLTESGTPYGKEQQAREAARALAADIASAFAEMEILVKGNPDLKPGKAVTLKGAGPVFDGEYTVTTARHEFGLGSENGYQTWVTVTGRQVRNVYSLASGASRSTARIPGVVNAIVTNIDDTTGQGRVKVRFPWFDDTYETEWVRTLQFGGKGGGGVISPAVGDEVLVAFDRGDIDFPYVLGGLYSNKLPPSEHDAGALAARGHLNRQSLVSRAGHRLELLDAADMRGVRLRSGDKKLTVYLDEIESTIEISSAGTVTVHGGGGVTIEGDVRITGDVRVDGALNVTGAAAGFTVGEFNVTAIAPSTIKGPLVIINTMLFPA